MTTTGVGAGDRVPILTQHSCYKYEMLTMPRCVSHLSYLSFLSITSLSFTSTYTSLLISTRAYLLL